ncbi:MAG: hypothetical protein ACYC8T_08230 [Myxococcaceae bacterium]
MRLPLLALLFSASALADSQGALRLWVGSGVDSNARRDFTGSNGLSPEQDLVFSAIASAEGRYRGPSTMLTGAYDLGLREFMRLPSENVVIQSGSLGASAALGRTLGLGLDARAKDRRGGERDYSDLLAEAFVEFVPDAKVSLKLHGGAHRFLYRGAGTPGLNEFGYSFGAPELGATARYRFDKRHSAFVSGDLGLRRYMAYARPHPLNPDEEPEIRKDQVLSGSAGYTYRGPVTLALTYSYIEQDSNSYGETVLRHRISLTGGTRLPWDFTLLAQVVVQPTNYLEPLDLCADRREVSASCNLQLTEDEDWSNSVSVKLARPVSEHVDAELRYAFSWGELPKNGLRYRRQLGWLGLTWRL